MAVIRILPDILKNKIAAGEVVERPASVLKELLENSLDAQCTEVAVHIERAGRKLIRVTDNGLGMDREDALRCMLRHATSKLVTEDDLFNIRTLGFRGEALPSIASVSRLTLSTAPRGATEGIKATFEAGELRAEAAASAHGTTVEVRDLFYNTPARKKFLKRDTTELTHIIDTLTRATLSNAAVSFKLYIDGAETLNLSPASGLRERIAQVYGTEFMDGLLEIKSEAGEIGIHAFVSHPARLRDTRSHQYLFVNARPVSDRSLSHAVYSAYEGMAPAEKYPVYFLFLQLDPRKVDFNVHPAKREVRFQDKEVVYRAIRRCLSGGLLPQRSGVAEDGTPGAAIGVQPAGGTGSVRYDAEADPSRHSAAEALEFSLELGSPHIYLGDTFVAVAENGGLTLIDHHAAHERILYEKFLDGLRLKSMQLLFPRQVTLSPKEHLQLLEHREMLAEFGIEIEDFGSNTVNVRALPQEMDEADLRGVLSDAADELSRGQKPGRSIREAVAARIACHSSIRGSRVLGPENLAALLEDLKEARDPEHCPHGRPTRIHYPMSALRKMFRRS